MTTLHREPTLEEAVRTFLDGHTRNHLNAAMIPNMHEALARRESEPPQEPPASDLVEQTDEEIRALIERLRQWEQTKLSTLDHKDAGELADALESLMEENRKREQETNQAVELVIAKDESLVKQAGMLKALKSDRDRLSAEVERLRDQQNPKDSAHTLPSTSA